MVRLAARDTRLPPCYSPIPSDDGSSQHERAKFQSVMLSFIESHMQARGIGWASAATNVVIEVIIQTVQQIARLAVLWLCLVPLVAISANFGSATVKGISTAYGYVLGQEFALAQIENDFPDLAANVLLARAQFGAAFPGVRKKLELRLKEILSEKEFPGLLETMQTKTSELGSRQKVTRANAIDFLGQVKARSQGAIESPVLEYLLAVQYQNNSLREFGDGYRQRYQTSDSGKSQGIKIKLQLPKSWTAKDGERPHIVQKWTSLNNDYSDLIQLIVVDAEGYSPTKQDTLQFIADGEAKSAIPDGATFVASGNFSLEKQTGYWVEMTSSVERAGFTIYQESMMYQLFFRGKGIAILCSTSGRADEPVKVGEAFQRMKPLCQQVVNSLVLPQAY
jgi:hypothetical protein